MYLRKIIKSLYKDEMEIEPSNVELHELLGEGAFGIVRKAVLKPNNREIAVKMLKGCDDCFFLIENNVNLEFKCSFFDLLYRKCQY